MAAHISKLLSLSVQSSSCESICSAGQAVDNIVPATGRVSGALNLGLCRRLTTQVVFSLAFHRPLSRAGAGRGGPPRAAGDAQFLAPYGAGSIVQTHAFAWQRYMHRYGATREALAALALNSRRNANLNPRAFFFKEPMTVTTTSMRDGSPYRCVYSIAMCRSTAASH